MKLSIIIPCYNEEKTIKDIILAIQNADIKDYEIIIVDDCSNDNTKEILQSFNRKEIKIFFQKKNMGKGSALRKGFKEANGDICIIQDADLEYDPNEYSLIIEQILKNKADVVYGSRFQGGKAS